MPLLSRSTNQGVERTTIADIAPAADVPLGNVYYYFKMKDDIVDAVANLGSEIRFEKLSEKVSTGQAEQLLEASSLVRAV
jgi:AcrR family transcriptional regulator